MNPHAYRATEWGGIELADSRIPVEFLMEGGIRVEGEFLRFLAPRTVDALRRRGPLEGRLFKTHGGIYFCIPLSMGNEKPIQEVQRGTIAYWPRPSAICIFLEGVRFGDKVTRLGAVREDLLAKLGDLREGSRIRMVLG
ncbi:MAG: cyclophilin-like fold protein [Candidatus Bathyarchaeia archaeon]